MEYTFTDTEGNTSLVLDSSFLQQVLDLPYSHWQGGTGDSAIQVKDEEQLIFFKTAKGIFIMQHPDYLAPLFTNSDEQPIIFSHYIGGEPMDIPEACLCNEATALTILQNYIDNKELPATDFRWVDFTELLPD